MVWPTLGSRTAKEQNRTAKFIDVGQVIPVVTCRSPAPLRTRDTNRLNSENNRGARNVPVPIGVQPVCSTLRRKQSACSANDSVTFWSIAFIPGHFSAPYKTSAGLSSRVVIAKFHYTGPTGPDQTKSADFVGDPGLPPGSGEKVRAGPCGSGRARVASLTAV